MEFSLPCGEMWQNASYVDCPFRGCIVFGALAESVLGPERELQAEPRQASGTAPGGVVVAKTRVDRASDYAGHQSYGGSAECS